MPGLASLQELHDLPRESFRAQWLNCCIRCKSGPRVLCKKCAAPALAAPAAAPAPERPQPSGSPAQACTEQRCRCAEAVRSCSRPDCELRVLQRALAECSEQLASLVGRLSGKEEAINEPQTSRSLRPRQETTAKRPASPSHNNEDSTSDVKSSDDDSDYEPPPKLMMPRLTLTPVDRHHRENGEPDGASASSDECKNPSLPAPLKWGLRSTRATVHAASITPADREGPSSQTHDSSVTGERSASDDSDVPAKRLRLRPRKKLQTADQTKQPTADKQKPPEVVEEERSNKQKPGKQQPSAASQEASAAETAQPTEQLCEDKQTRNQPPRRSKRKKMNPEGSPTQEPDVKLPGASGGKTAPPEASQGSLPGTADASLPPAVREDEDRRQLYELLSAGLEGPGDPSGSDSPLVSPPGSAGSAKTPSGSDWQTIIPGRVVQSLLETVKSEPPALPPDAFRQLDYDSNNVSDASTDVNEDLRLPSPPQPAASTSISANDTTLDEGSQGRAETVVSRNAAKKKKTKKKKKKKQNGKSKKITKDGKSKKITKEKESGCICAKCGRLYSSRYRLRRHLKDGDLCQRRAQRWAYACTNQGCDRRFPTPYDLRVHERKVHGSESLLDFPCEFCPRRFKMPHGLANHSRQIHKLSLAAAAADAPFDPCPCLLCGRMFDNRPAVECHMSRHMVGMQYKCMVCSQTWRMDNELEKHIRKTHPDIPKSAQDPDSPENLEKEQHENTQQQETVRRSDDGGGLEKRFRCEYCHFMMKKQSSLSAHRRAKHANELIAALGVDGQMFCPVCEVNFKTKEEVKEHNKLHDGQTDFKCLVCQRVFKYLGTLIHHINTLHRLEMAGLRQDDIEMAPEEDEQPPRQRRRPYLRTPDEYLVLARRREAVRARVKARKEARMLAWATAPSIGEEEGSGGETDCGNRGKPKNGQKVVHRDEARRGTDDEDVDTQDSEMNSSDQGKPRNGQKVRGDGARGGGKNLVQEWEVEDMPDGGDPNCENEQLRKENEGVQKENKGKQDGQKLVPGDAQEGKVEKKQVQKQVVEDRQEGGTQNCEEEHNQLHKENEGNKHKESNGKQNEQKLVCGDAAEQSKDENKQTQKQQVENVQEDEEEKSEQKNGGGNNKELKKGINEEEEKGETETVRVNDDDKKTGEKKKNEEKLVVSKDESKNVGENQGISQKKIDAGKGGEKSSQSRDRKEENGDKNEASVGEDQKNNSDLKH